MLNEPKMQPIPDERELTSEEYELARWILEHGKAEAGKFLLQLDRARVMSRCPCGCASIDFTIAEMSAPSGGMQILGDFVFGEESNLCGVFVFARNGILAGIEVYGIVGDAPKTLPPHEWLRPFETSVTTQL
jgi:hypothetical protein